MPAKDLDAAKPAAEHTAQHSKAQIPSATPYRTDKYVP